MADPIVATAKAIYQQLASNVSVPVYDYVPAEAAYPYVEINRHILVSDDYLVARKETINTYIFVYSEYEGQKEVLELLSEIYSALHQKQLSLDAGRMVRCFVDNRDTTRDMDDLTFTGRVVVRSIVEH